MLAFVAQPLAFAPPVAALRPVAPAASSVRMETIADLEGLAEQLNPTVKFQDPLNLANADFWGKGEAATIGWLRHAEIKHGRIAMFAFVGFCVQANGLYFPWGRLSSQVTYAEMSAAGSPFEQWDALPTESKLQIFAAIGLLEFIGEGGNFNTGVGAGGDYVHYARGGKPGEFPSTSRAGVPHPMPFDLFDPFKLSKNASPAKKEKGLRAEVNNGRLAMIGIFGFLAEAKFPGSVPGISAFAPHYAGEPMAPFAASDNLPLVPEMLAAFQAASFGPTSVFTGA